MNPQYGGGAHSHVGKRSYDSYEEAQKTYKLLRLISVINIGMKRVLE